VKARHAVRPTRKWHHGFVDGLLAAWTVAISVAAISGRWLIAERVLSVATVTAVVVLIVVVWRAR
jgi:hypothetical protein